MLTATVVIAVSALVLISWVAPEIHARRVRAGGLRRHFQQAAQAVTGTTHRRWLARFLALVALLSEGALLTLAIPTLAGRVDEAYFLTLGSLVFLAYAGHTSYVIRFHPGLSCGCGGGFDDTANVWSLLRALLPGMAAASVLASGADFRLAGSAQLTLALTAGTTLAVVLWLLPDSLTLTRPCDIKRRDQDFRTLLLTLGSRRDALDFSGRTVP